jgi:hypothetical protein
MNNRERELWILNDEELYRWWKATRMSMTRFLKECREIINEFIGMRVNSEYGRYKRT